MGNFCVKWAQAKFGNLHKIDFRKKLFIWSPCLFGFFWIALSSPAQPCAIESGFRTINYDKNRGEEKTTFRHTFKRWNKGETNLMGPNMTDAKKPNINLDRKQSLMDISHSLLFNKLAMQNWNIFPRKISLDLFIKVKIRKKLIQVSLINFS